MRTGRNLRIMTFWHSFTGPFVRSGDIERARWVARQTLQTAIQSEIDRAGDGAMIGAIHERKVNGHLVLFSQKAAWIIE